MSTYCTIGGEISYQNKKDFDAALSVLRVGGWLKENNFIDDSPTFINERSVDIDHNLRVINIPCSHYRNLGYTLENLVKDGKGVVVWTCTDGCFEGGVITDGHEEAFDLRLWAKENMEGDDAVPPDFDNEFEAYCEWQQLVEQEFFEEFL